MKILKKIVLVLVVLVLALIVIGFLMPSTRHVERSVTINAKPEAAFVQVNDLKNWPNWSPWYKMDPSCKMVYSEPSSGTGANYTWDSQNSNVGKGKMTIEESTAPSMVKTKIEFEGMNESHAYFKFEPEGEGTKATWGFDANLGNNPFFRLMGSMMDGMLGGIFEGGLNDLKKASESAPAPIPAEQAPVIPVDSAK